MTQIPEIVEQLSPLVGKLHDNFHLVRIKDFSSVFPYCALKTLDTFYCRQPEQLTSSKKINKTDHP